MRMPKKTTAPVKAASKTVTPPAKPVVGSKATDVAKKPTISTTPVDKEKSRPKPTVSGTPFRPESKLKPFEKMTDKKEHKPATTIAAELASRQQKLIQHLENAKIRIKNKVYGICRETGKLISKERLRAVPHATLSIEAKQAQN